MRELRTSTVMPALVALAVLLVPGTAYAAGPVAAPSSQPSAPATPALTVAATPGVVTAGDAARLIVRLGIPGAAVQLSSTRAGAAEPTFVRQLTTGAGGSVACRATPRVSTSYRVDYAGDGAQWLPASAEVGVSVSPRVSFAVAKRVYRGRKAVLSVAVRPPHPGAAVTIRRYGDGAWTDVRTLTLDAGSRARATWRPGTDGVTRLRGVMPADTGHAEGVSPVHRVQVVRPNPYDVPLDAAGIIVVDLSQYTLRFYSHGRLLRTFPCVTGRPSLPTPIGRFRVYARGMWPGGPYGARIMSYHPPCAIHGTNQPWLLSRFPRNFSHGCTRLLNADAIWLYDHAPLGTPVWNVR
jgi:lipoprotein-anchoring transpeptidase ErfK/SrfK